MTSAALPWGAAPATGRNAATRRKEMQQRRETAVAAWPSPVMTWWPTGRPGRAAPAPRYMSVAAEATTRARSGGPRLP